MIVSQHCRLLFLSSSLCDLLFLCRMWSSFIVPHAIIVTCYFCAACGLHVIFIVPHAITVTCYFCAACGLHIIFIVPHAIIVTCYLFAASGLHIVVPHASLTNRVHYSWVILILNTISTND